MYRFSNSSSSNLATCHPLLQELFEEVIKHVDCTVIEGVRTLEKQKEYVRKGVSQTLNSKHLPQDDNYSHAVDVIAYPIDWEDRDRNLLFAAFVKGVATAMGIDIRIGADWDGDFITADQSFHDLPHFELQSTERQHNKKSSTQKEHLPSGPSDSDINASLDEIEDSIFAED